MIVTSLESAGVNLNGRMILTPDEAKLITGISVGQQANLRSQNRLPFSYLKSGGKIGISIVALAKWIAGEQEEYVKEELKPIFNQPMPIGVKKNQLNRLAKKNEKGKLKRGWSNMFMAQLQERLSILHEHDYIDSIISTNVKTSPKNRF
ncbi:MULTISPECIES: hypothetical protein [Burkholderia]|uniref:hypothetical protein n=1 Tax=Burkholderia TaxID=32008 RepID=UPI00117C1E43|nr:MULTISPECIES: hypothetical protein [Burkholderia]